MVDKKDHRSFGITDLRIFTEGQSGKTYRAQGVLVKFDYGTDLTYRENDDHIPAGNICHFIGSRRMLETKKVGAALFA